MTVMCRVSVEMIFILIFCCCSYAAGEIDLNELIRRNTSDENVLLKLLVLHMEDTDRELKELREKLQTYDINRNELIELRAMIQNMTDTPQRREMPGSTKIGRLFIDNIYKKKNIPTSTEIPVVPAINMSTTEQLLKLFVRRTCDDWLKAGFTSSGTYTIDPDGQGIGEAPFAVYCDMLTGFTFLRHDMDIGQHSPTPCTGISCYKAKVSYSASESQIKALIQSSQSCQQLITVDCFESPLEYENQQLSWWTGADGRRHYDWSGGGSDDHTCTCGLLRSCVNPMKPCNCDAMLPNVWVTDTGYVTNSSALPIQEIVLGAKYDYSPLQVKFKVGPLRCHGSRSLSYPTSCLDMFLHGGRRSGWYVVGEPDALRVTFCDMESLYETEAKPSPILLSGTEPVDVDLGDLVLQNLRSKGFLILKEEQYNQMLKSVDEKLVLMNSDLERSENQTKNDIMRYVNETVISSQNITDTMQIEVQNKLSSIDEIVRKNITNLKQYIIADKTIVLFQAYKKPGALSYPAIIKYETVTHNEGNGYSSETGKFTAPVAGFYYFAAYAAKFNGNLAYFYILKNGAYIAFARDGETNYDYNTMGTAVIVDLKVGDEIEVSLREGNIYADDNDIGNSFMGYLLHEF